MNSVDLELVNLAEDQMTFKTFNLSEPISRALDDLKFSEPTDIQKKAIPLLLEHQGDFVGQAQTGTGKTGAFLIPLLEKIDLKKSGVQALILAPTRELANQVNAELEKFAKHMKIHTTCVYGGVSYDRQIRSLNKKGPQIVVGTPGRLLDLIDRKNLKLKNANHIIIDEADEMLNMGFLEDVEKLISSAAESRQIWMFSATMPSPILNMIKKNFKNTEIIKTKNKTLSNEDILQQYCVVKSKYFPEALARLIQTADDFYGIVFCQTRADANRIHEELQAKGIPTSALHGDLSQGQRDQAMMSFKKKKTTVLACTDVAARGIDINDLSHVVNYGLPRNLESYVHRIGRTGRAGRTGVAIAMVGARDVSKVRRIEKFTGKKMVELPLPSTTKVKELKVAKELSRMNIIKEVILDKGENFRIDETFDYFKDELKSLKKEELLKLIFSYHFNHQFKRLDDIGDLSEDKNARRERSDGPRRRPNRRGKSGGRSSRSSSSSSSSSDRSRSRNRKRPATGRSSAKKKTSRSR